MSAAEKSGVGRKASYRVRHTTSCQYSAELLLAHHLLHLRPRPVEGQSVSSYRVEVEPSPAALFDHLDYFGNPTTYLSIQRPHRRVAIEVGFDIAIADAAPLQMGATASWELMRRDLALCGDDQSRQASRFAFDSTMIPALPELAEFAAPSFAAGRPIAEAAFDLVVRIHREFEFDPVATDIATPLGEVLVLRRGVCQDFAHLAIGCLRALGLAARYVSGYLRTEPPPGAPRLVGADQSHAWLSVWCGKERWLDLDPTNGQVGSTDHVTLAWGRDYSDVSPMRGVLIGSGAQDLAVQVDVERLGES